MGSGKPKVSPVFSSLKDSDLTPSLGEPARESGLSPGARAEAGLSAESKFTDGDAVACVLDANSSLTDVAAGVDTGGEGIGGWVDAASTVCSEEHAELITSRSAVSFFCKRLTRSSDCTSRRLRSATSSSSSEMRLFLRALQIGELCHRAAHQRTYLDAR